MSDTTSTRSAGQSQSDAFKFLDKLPDDQLLALRNAVRKKVKTRGLAAPKTAGEKEAKKAARKAAKTAAQAT